MLNGKLLKDATPEEKKELEERVKRAGEKYFHLHIDKNKEDKKMEA